MATEPTETFYEAFKRPSMTDAFQERLPSFAVSGVTQGLTGLASALGGFASNFLVKSGLGNRANAGSSIGSTIGSTLGSYLFGPAGGFLLGGIGGALGSNFGPQPTVGPNGQAWLRGGPQGLEIIGSSGDNGIGQMDFANALQPGINSINQYLAQNGASLRQTPGYFQVRGGENGMQPTIEIGNNVDDAFLAPHLSDASILKTLIQRGFVDGDRDALLAGLGGADPRRIFTGTSWEEPESIAAPWQGGIYRTQSGYEALDTGRVGNVMLQDHYAPGSNFGWTDSGYQGFAGGGLIDGLGGGMDDDIDAHIDGQQPAALSSGEFVVPADVVSALGDGNTKAGAKKLEGIISLIRQKKYGRNRQPPPIGNGLIDLLKSGKM